MANFTRIPLIYEDPLTGQRKSVGVVVIALATYEVLEFKVFQRHDVPEEWRKAMRVSE